jgi:hypothetical protein
MVRKEEVVKKGLSREWWIGIAILILILLVVGYFVFFSGEDLDKDLLPPSDSSITGNVFLSYTPLTLEQLREGIQLGGDDLTSSNSWERYGWNRLYWTNELDGNVPIEEALGSILDESHYILDYSDLSSGVKYWFNPIGDWARYNNYSSYGPGTSRYFDELKPGKLYYARMKDDAVLKYPLGPKSVRIILTDGSERVVGEGEEVCVDVNGITSVNVVPCVDSDGGADFAEFGTVTVINANGTYNYVDECKDLRWLEEKKCDSVNINVEIKKAYCGYGCINGTCLSERPATCTETDNGDDPNEQGVITTYDLAGNIKLQGSDKCADSTNSRGDVFNLLEYYCDSVSSTRFGMLSKFCPNGCSDGACITNTTTCTDSDGGLDYDTKGTTSAPGNTTTDFCWRDYVAEFYCEGSEVKQNSYRNCPNGCSDGACVGGEGEDSVSCMELYNLVRNNLNTYGVSYCNSSSYDARFDVNKDGYVAPSDLNIVVTRLNQNTSASNAECNSYYQNTTKPYFC